jgi:hypothetical protein
VITVESPRYKPLTATVAGFVDLTSMVVDQIIAEGDRVLAFCRLRPVTEAVRFA